MYPVFWDSIIVSLCYVLNWIIMNQMRRDLFGDCIIVLITLATRLLARHIVKADFEALVAALVLKINRGLVAAIFHRFGI